MTATDFVRSSRVWRFALVGAVVAALVTLVATFASNHFRVARGTEDARGCDWFGYMRQGRLFKDKGFRGLDTAIRDDRTLLLIELAKSFEVPLPLWDYGVAPHAHHYEPRTDRVILQYPPGTGFLIALFPEGCGARWTYVCCSLGILLCLSVITVNARTVIVPALMTLLGFTILYLLYWFRFDRSIPPTALACVGAAYLTVAASVPSSDRRQLSLIAALGFLFGLSVNFRLPNLLLAGGPALVMSGQALISRSRIALLRLLVFSCAVVTGLFPVLVANRINAGSPFATTYGSNDTSAPVLGWDAVHEALTFYFVGHRNAGTAVMLAAVVLAAVLALRPRLRPPAIANAALMGVISLAINLAFFFTHQPLVGYYLLPAAFYGLSTGIFCLSRSEGLRTAGMSGLGTTAKMGALISVAAVAVGTMLSVPMPLSPLYKREGVEVEFEANAIVWANIEVGNIHYFLHRQASVLPFISDSVRDRMIAALLEKKVPQYFVIESGDQDYEQIMQTLARNYDLQRAGRLFGHEVLVLRPGAAPRREASGN
jgi:hypothetical protein